MKREQKMEILKSLVTEVYTKWEKDEKVEFSREEIQKAFQSAWDTVADEEIEGSDEEFTAIYKEWIEDSKNTVLDWKREER